MFTEKSKLATGWLSLEMFRGIIVVYDSDTIFFFFFFFFLDYLNFGLKIDIKLKEMHQKYILLHFDTFQHLASREIKGIPR